MTEENPQTSREIELRGQRHEILRASDTDSWTQVIGSVAKLADYIAGTEFVPKGLRGKPAAAAAAMLYGREVGLPPMTALNSTHVIEGSPSISAEMMRAMVLAEGHELEFTDTTGAKCTVRGRRRGSDSWTTVEWTIDMARAAKLLGKDNWQKWPRRMLQARASSELCELLFPDVIHGFKATEELQDSFDGDGPEEQASDSTPVARQGGARKRAAKKAAPPPQAGADEVPLPDELDDQDGQEKPSEEPAAGPDQGSDSPSPEAEPASLPPEPSGSDEGPAAAEGDPEPESGEADGEKSTPSSSTDSGSSSEPDEDGVVDAEVVGEDNSPPPRMSTGPQMRALHAMLNKLGYKGDEDRDARLAAVSTIVGRVVESTNQLTYDDASALIDTLATCKTREHLETLLQGIRDAEAEREHGGDS